LIKKQHTFPEKTRVPGGEVVDQAETPETLEQHFSGSRR
jgi:hypothetical protein